MPGVRRTTGPAHLPGFDQHPVWPAFPPYKDTINAETGLISYWRLGEASTASPVADEKNVNNGTYFGGTVGTTGMVNADPNTAYTTASTNYARLKSGRVVSGLANWSIELWLKTSQSGPPGPPALYAERAASGNDIVKLEFNGSGQIELVYRDDAGTLTTITATPVFNDNKIHHLVVTKAGTAIVIYVDGNPVKTGTVAGTDTFTNASVETRIGTDIADANANYVGDLDEVAAYNVTLTPSQVTAHWNSGKFGRAPVTGTIFTDTVAGTVTLTGSSAESNSRSSSPAGTVTFTGTVSQSASHTSTPTGTVILSGTRTETAAHTSSPVGTVSLTGTRTETGIHVVSPSGTVTLGGARAENVSHSSAPAGTVAVTGTATESSTAPLAAEPKEWSPFYDHGGSYVPEHGADLWVATRKRR